MTEKTVFAALMTHAQLANLATEEQDRQAHTDRAQELARELLEEYPADLLSVTIARAGLGQLAYYLRKYGVDPREVALATETVMFLGDLERPAAD